MASMTIEIKGSYDVCVSLSGSSVYEKHVIWNDCLGIFVQEEVKYKLRSAIRFSLSNLPSGANVTRVRVRLKVRVAGGAAHLGDIHPYNANGQADPEADGAEDCYNRCAAGTEYIDDSTEFRATGVKWFTLGDGETAQACVDVENAKSAVNRFSIGLHEEGDNDDRAEVEKLGSVPPGGPTPPLLEITFEYLAQGHFKWYKQGWQNQDEQLIDVENEDELRFRVCIHEERGQTASNLDINVEYSTDKENWESLGAQGATDKVWRWRDDPALAEHQAIDQARLSCTTENGLVHENTCVDSENVSANRHHEISIILEPYSAQQGATYYFRVIAENYRLPKDSEVSEYVNCQMYTPPAVGYQFSDGLVTVQVAG